MISGDAAGMLSVSNLESGILHRQFLLPVSPTASAATVGITQVSFMIYQRSVSLVGMLLRLSLVQ